MNRLISIDQSGNPVGNQGQMHCRKSTNDTISWTAQGSGQTWTIEFISATPISLNGSPVTSLTADTGSASTQYTVTGAVGDYSYTITDAGGTGGDPDIIVDD